MTGSNRSQLSARLDGPDLVLVFLDTGLVVDPKLSYRHFLEQVETQVGPQQYAIDISQPLPWLGKLRRQREVASQLAHSAESLVPIFAFLQHVLRVFTTQDSH